MVHKAFEIVGEKALIQRLLNKRELSIIKENLGDIEEFINLSRMAGFTTEQIENKIEELKRMGKTRFLEKLGIFQDGKRFETTTEGAPRAALDFIEPIYDLSPTIEKLARGIVPRERINSENPILSIHYGVDHTLLKYEGERDNTHVFRGKLWYAQGVFINDGNPQIFDIYKEQLRKAKFRIV